MNDKTRNQVLLVLFLGVHSTRIVADSWRTATIARVGEKPWKGIYSLLSIAGYREPVRSIGRPLVSAGAPAALPAWRLVKHGNQSGLAGARGAAVGTGDGWTASEGVAPPIDALRLLQQEAGK